MRQLVIIEILKSWFNELMIDELNAMSDEALLDHLLQMTYEYARA